MLIQNYPTWFVLVNSFAKLKSVKNSDLENFIEEIHQDCFDMSFFYKRHIFQLKPSLNEANFGIVAPTVLGCVSSDDKWLDITFILQNIPKPIDIPNFDLKNASHTDFLWEQNCLELFISDKQSAYYEINVSLDGKFAVYQFDDYRSPTSMPPRKSSDITLQWRNVEQQNRQSRLDLVYQFSLLFSQCASFAVENIELINPCTILYTDNTPMFYAVNHAIPPDFHDKACWLNF